MSVGGAYWICAWMGITDRRTGAQWQGLHGMQSGLGYLSFGLKKPSPHRHVYRSGELLCFTAVWPKFYMEGSSAQGAGPSSGSLEIRVRCSRRKHSSETSRENISEMG